MSQTIMYMTVAEARENQNHSDIKLSPPLPHTHANLKNLKPNLAVISVLWQGCVNNMKPARLVSNNKIKTFVDV